MPDLIGHTLGQYRIVEQIGMGGMATVYKAYQPSLDRYVAVKILPAYYAHEPGFAERFTREARAVAKLTHPHVLPIYDFGQQDDLSYIVMQYVDAGTLKDMLGQPLSLITATSIIEQIADALDYAHDQGVIHRDVKPSNVLMDRGRWALLSDFGLAKMVEGSVQLTGSGVGVGTPAYMAPEQGQGLKVNRRADIYSLGIILYEMVTGRVPFQAETPMAIVVKHITEPLPLPRNINPNLPESVERVIMKSLAKNPDDRYKTTGEMAAALRKVVAGLDTEAAVDAVPLPVGQAEGPTLLDEGDGTQLVPPPKTSAKSPLRGLPTWAKIGAGMLVFLCLACGLLSMMRNAAERKNQATHIAATGTAQIVAAETPSAAREETVAAPTPGPTEPPSRPILADTLSEKAITTFAERNPPIFKDDFSDPDSGWAVADSRQGQEGFYQDGTYVVRVPEIPGEETMAILPLPISTYPSDFILQFDLVNTEGGGGANWSIGFRVNPETSFYAVLRAGPPACAIGRVEGSNETVLAQKGLPDYVPGEKAEVTLVAIGPAIMLYLDGERVAVARSEPLPAGALHFQPINTGDPMVAYRFDNVRLWDLSPLAEKSAPDDNAFPPLFEDFEDGQANGWKLDPGWKIIQEEDNHVLLGERHTWATVGGNNWGDFHLSFRMKPLEEDIHLNFRADPEQAGDIRYMIHFVPDEVKLHRNQGEDRKMDLANKQVELSPNEWHQVELLAVGGRIELVVDGELFFEYDDPNPLPPGIVAFEVGDPPARYLIDDVAVEPIQP